MRLRTPPDFRGMGSIRAGRLQFQPSIAQTEYRHTQKAAWEFQNDGSWTPGKRYPASSSRQVKWTSPIVLLETRLTENTKSPNRDTRKESKKNDTHENKKGIIYLPAEPRESRVSTVAALRSKWRRWSMAPWVRPDPRRMRKCQRTFQTGRFRTISMVLCPIF